MIGVARPRIDAPDKVTGATRYAADGYVHGLLHARLVLSTEPHALIERIDREDALAIPGVVAVLDAADLPIASRTPTGPRSRSPASEVVFAGQPVAIVVAESEAAAEDGAEAVLVEYEPLEAVLDVEAAMRPGAALARRIEESDRRAAIWSRSTPASTTGRRHDEEEQLSANVLDRVTAAPATPRPRSQASDAVVSGDVPDAVGLPGVHRAAGLRRRGSSPTGTLVVSTSTQGSFVTRSELARAFDLPLERIRVDRGATRRRVRRQVRARRAARRGRRARPSPRPCGSC